ncbi:MAG: Gfo/Idh/MocA family oxidoreductase [Phycisphaerae bacterium]|nr:Gfo/Idh/MocA family oxidoreductase [Phycisphaerae bacterium]
MNNHTQPPTRRMFLKSSAVATASVALGLDAALMGTARGANDKVRVGMIGAGNRGTQLLEACLKQPDVEIAALCDVYDPYLSRNYADVEQRVRDAAGDRIPRMGETFGSGVARYKDFRRVLERKDIDAVVIATPDHWHAIQTIQACQAGKDVYVEKPLSVTIVEGRKMAEAAKRYNRIVQVGLHRRSSQQYSQLGRLVQGGKIGQVTLARAYRVSNMDPRGIGKCVPSQPPKSLDWDMWLGPRAMRPYQDNITPYKFRWWQSYSSQVGNWGVHYFDAIRWILGQTAPLSVCAYGGKYVIDDDRTIPDTLEVTFEMPGGQLLVFGQYEACGISPLGNAEIELRGTLGNLVSRTGANGYDIIPSDRGQFQSRDARIQAEQVPRGSGNENDMTVDHIRNFIDCVKSRQQPRCDLETGHRSTSFAHLANISLATGSRIDWDPQTERITNNEKANALLHYEYRRPWTLG